MASTFYHEYSKKIGNNDDRENIRKNKQHFTNDCSSQTAGFYQRKQNEGHFIFLLQ